MLCENIVNYDSAGKRTLAVLYLKESEKKETETDAMKLRDKAKDILNLFNYYTGAVVTDEEGTIQYYYTSLKEINSLQEKDVIGRSILEVYPSITRESSTIFKVLQTGEPICNREQTLTNMNQDVFTSINSTFPIKAGDAVIGAVELYSYRPRSEVQHALNVDVPKGSWFNLYSTSDLISKSVVMEELKHMIQRVSATKSTVLIYGETGTGKELVAQSIHTASNRASNPFIAQNCAAIPENLLESILFGSVKGSYTDAKDKPGLLEIASGGTIFLDEIHTMGWSVQAKLLKALEEKTIYRVGGTEPIPVDVRVIAAVNKPPQQCVKDGLLREDLYYRLKVVQMHIPPLRERREDIRSLLWYFISFFNKKMNRDIRSVSDEVVTFFENYSWPGNVRELKNAVECAFNFCRSDQIQLDDIDVYEDEIEAVSRELAGKDQIQKEAASLPLKKAMKEYEKEILQGVIAETSSFAEAAARLGISRQNLHHKLKEFNITKQEESV